MDDEHRDRSHPNISDLPDEILRKLFSYFSPQELCSTLASICTKWHQFSRDKLLWRNLTLKSATLHSATRLFQYAPLGRLTTLTVEELADSADADRVVALVSKQCTSLDCFTLGNCFRLSDQSLVNLAASCPEIKTLSLTGGEFVAFARFPKLTRLRIGRVYLFLAKHATIFDECERLRSLDLALRPSNISVTRKHLESFLDKHKLRLRRLDIFDEDNKIPESCYMKLATCVNVLELELCGGNGLTDTALAVILSGMKQLRTFHLEWAPSLVTSAQLIPVLSNESYLNNLEKLVLQDIDVLSDEVLIVIANRFRTQLKSLNLEEQDCNSQVTDKGLVRIVTKCTNLESLSLSGLGNVSEAFLWPVPRYLTKLTSLTMWECNIDLGTITELKNAMPNLTVYNQGVVV